MKPAITLLAIGAVIGIIWGQLTLNGKSEPSIVVASSAEVATVIEDLGPGDTLHFVRVQYRAEVTRKSVCPAGTVRHESWETFGMDGALVSSRTEARTEDGALCSAAEIVGDELVFTDGNGVVYERRVRVTDERLKPPTLETKKASVRQAQALVFEALGQSEASEATLGNEQVVVWEGLDGDVMTRHTVLPDVGFEVQTETLQVMDGQEVLVESTLYEVYEVVSE